MSGGFQVEKMSESVLLNTGSSRTFYEVAVLQTTHSTSRTGWPLGHLYTSLDYVAFLEMMKCSHD
jgi:hypothetical protein